MNRLIIACIISFFATSMTQAHFADGAYVGGGVGSGFNLGKVRYDIEKCPFYLRQTARLTGYVVPVGVFVGYGMSSGKVFYGAELVLGYGIGSISAGFQMHSGLISLAKESISIKNSFYGRLIGRLGYYIIDDGLLYFRVGVGTSMYKITSSFTKKPQGYHRPFVSPGIGFEWKMNDKLSSYMEAVNDMSIGSRTAKYVVDGITDKIEHTS